MSDSTLTKLGNPDARADRRLEVFETRDPALRVTLNCTGTSSCSCTETRSTVSGAASPATG